MARLSSITPVFYPVPRILAAVDVTIGRRFNGPPGSGNGGYSAGLVARALGGGLGDAGPVQVTLRRPPPIDRPLRLAVTEGDAGGRQARLLDGDDLVADAVPATLAGAAPLPDPIGIDEAEKLAAAFDADDYRAHHPFPTCFTCGPDRAPGDGLRLFPGAVAPGLVAWPWRPDASTAGDDDGLVAPELVWAALDCPSGLCWFHERPPVGPHVLGRMTAAVHRRPAVGEPLVASGFLVEVAGRKRQTGSVVWDAAGAVVAESRTTWIGLDEEQLARFGTATGG
ncbi:MAG TPA: hypothetical protein VIL36_02565 [Acidimicrobiales bacterium]